MRFQCCKPTGGSKNSSRNRSSARSIFRLAGRSLASFPKEHPTDHTLVKQLISSAHRMLNSLAVNRKLCLQSHLKLLIEKYKFASLEFLQIPTLIALGFVGFLRWDDLTSFNVSDLSFHNNHFNWLFVGKA